MQTASGHKFRCIAFAIGQILIWEKLWLGSQFSD